MEPIAISTTVIMGGCSAIGSYFMGKGGDFLIEQATLKRKVKKLASQDKKYIKSVFGKSIYVEYPIERFFLKRYFKRKNIFIHLIHSRKIKAKSFIENFENMH